MLTTPTLDKLHVVHLEGMRRATRVRSAASSMRSAASRPPPSSGN